MSKGAEIRRKQGFYGPRTRTKPTVGDLGPRDPGPHGLTVPPQPKLGSDRWLSMFAAALAKRGRS